MRRRIYILLLIKAVLLCLAAVPAAAAESRELIPEKAFWRGFPQGGSYVFVQEDLGEFLFYSSGSGGKPATQTLYEAPITLPASGNSLVYHFTVTRGSCSVELIFADKDGEAVYRALGDALQIGAMQKEGTYKGVLTLNVFGQGELSFLGVRITCTDGGRLTVKALEVMKDGDVPEDAWANESSEAVSSPAESAEADESASAEETRPEESSRHSIFLPKEETSFTRGEIMASFTVMTAVSFLAIFLGIFICVTLFRRSRPD